MDNEKNQNDPLNALLEIIFSRKLLISIGFLSVFSISLAGAIYLPPVYTAYSSIYIKSPTPSRSEISYMKEFAGRTFLQNQVGIINSRLILEKVAGKLGMGETKISPGLKERLKDKIYALLKVSRPVPDPREQAIQYLNQSLGARASRGTDIVKIYATSTSPGWAAKLANTLAETYIEYTYSQLLNKIESGYGFIEQQFKTTSRNFTEAERILNEFKDRENIFSIVQENSLIINRLSEAEEKFDELNLQISSLEKQEYQIKKYSINPQQAPRISSLPYIRPETQKLNEQLKIFQSQLNDALTVFTENHPDVKILRKNIAKIEKKIAQDIQKNSDTASSGIGETDNMELQTLRLEIIKLKAARDNQSKRVKILTKKSEELRQKQIVLNKLTREFQDKQNTFLGTRSKLEDARILKEDEMAKGSIKIIDRAFPPSYSDKKRKMVLLAIGTIVAMVFGLGMAFIAEYLDDSLKTHYEAEKYLNLPVLGTVPHITMKIRKAA